MYFVSVSICVQNVPILKEKILIGFACSSSQSCIGLRGNKEFSLSPDLEYSENSGIFLSITLDLYCQEKKHTHLFI